MALHPGHIQYSPLFVAYVVSCFSINFWKVQKIKVIIHFWTGKSILNRLRFYAARGHKPDKLKHLSENVHEEGE